jgi:hypothetical protein
MNVKKLRVISLVLLILSVVGAAGIASYYQQRQRRQEITLQTKIRVLSDENEILARELQTIKILIGRDSEQRKIEKEVEKLRGLSFKKPLRYQRITREELPAYLIRELRSGYTEEEFKQYLLSLSVMGFLPKDLDLEKLLVDLLGEQIAAFYDEKKGELFTFETFDINRTTDRMIYAHEVTHALQDQNFDLNRNTPISRKDNDDRVVAARALIEGDATLLMTFYFQKHFDAVKFFSGDLFRMLGQPVEKLVNAPPYLRETLLFPYQQGQVFCLHLLEEGGFERINEAFRSLPESTKQILHPERYLQKRDSPIEVSWETLPMKGWEKIGDNVAGELGVRLLLQEQLPPAVASQAAEGWGGDRYQVFRVIAPIGRETRPRLPPEAASRGKTDSEVYAIVWLSQWDTESDARKFLKAYTSYFVKKNNLLPVDQTGNNDAFIFSFGGRQQTFTVKEKSVAVLDVPDSKDAETILKILWQKKPEK